MMSLPPSINRLEVYNQKTSPLIDFYRKGGQLKDFTSLSSQEIVEGIKKALQESSSLIEKYKPAGFF